MRVQHPKFTTKRESRRPLQNQKRCVTTDASSTELSAVSRCNLLFATLLEQGRSPAAAASPLGQRRLAHRDSPCGSCPKDCGLAKALAPGLSPGIRSGSTREETCERDFQSELWFSTSILVSRHRGVRHTCSTHTLIAALRLQ